jgi:hypothetical protein
MLVGSLVKTAIAALGSFWAFRLTKGYLPATATATFLLIHPKMLVRVQPLSDIYLTFFVLAAISTSILWWTHGSLKSASLTGIAIGLAIGTKPSGMLLLVLVPVMSMLHGNRIQHLKQSWAVVLGTIVGISPLCFHNYTSYGTLYWPGLPVARLEALEKSYNPHAIGAVRSVKRFLDGVLEGGIAPQWFFPFLVLAFWSVGCLYIRRRCRCRSLRFAVSTATFLLFAAGFCQAVLVRIEWRYWNFITPLAAVTTIVTCSRLSSVLVWFALAYSLYVGIDKLREIQNEDIRPIPREYYTVMNKLPDDAIVMTMNPWEFSFHTRRRSVLLPYSANDDLLLALANRFKIEYLVLIKDEQPYDRHPRFDSLVNGVFPVWLDRVHFDGNLVIGRFKLTR